MAKRTVHVVDDEEPVRRSLALMLKVSGYNVSTFDSGAALLDAAAALQGGAVAFLEKPFAKPALIDALDWAFLRLDDPEAYDRRRSAAAAAVHALSESDRALLASLATGRSSEGIAAELGISAASAEVRRARLFSELGAESLNEALGMAFAAGLQPSA